MAGQNDQRHRTALEITSLKLAGRCSIGPRQDSTYWTCSARDDTVEG